MAVMVGPWRRVRELFGGGGERPERPKWYGARGDRPEWYDPEVADWVSAAAGDENHTGESVAGELRKQGATADEVGYYLDRFFWGKKGRPGPAWRGEEAKRRTGETAGGERSGDEIDPGFSRQPARPGEEIDPGFAIALPPGRRGEDIDPGFIMPRRRWDGKQWVEVWPWWPWPWWPWDGPDGGDPGFHPRPRPRGPWEIPDGGDPGFHPHPGGPGDDGGDPGFHPRVPGRPRRPWSEPWPEIPWEVWRRWLHLPRRPWDPEDPRRWLLPEDGRHGDVQMMPGDDEIDEIGPPPWMEDWGPEEQRPWEAGIQPIPLARPGEGRIEPVPPARPGEGRIEPVPPARPGEGRIEPLSAEAERPEEGYGIELLSAKAERPEEDEEGEQYGAPTPSGAEAGETGSTGSGREPVEIARAEGQAQGGTSSTRPVDKPATPPPDPEKIKQRRQGFLPTAGARMQVIANPNTSVKKRQATDQEVLEQAFDVEPKEAARIAALLPAQQLAELKKLKVIEGNADQSQRAWNQMITARMMPAGVDPKSPEGKALAQQVKQFAQDTWNYFRLTQPSAEAAKAAVGGNWTQYVARSRTYYANAGLPYDEDAVKRVLSLAGDTQAFQHAKVTGKAPVGAGFVPPTDIVGAKGLDPEFARLLAKLQADAAKEGIEIRLDAGDRDGYRTKEDQEYLIGTTPGTAATTLNEHRLARGYDLTILVNGVVIKRSAVAKEWDTVGRLAEADGLYWGKRFRKPQPEQWHVQLYAPGYDPDINAAKAAEKAAKAAKRAKRGGGKAGKGGGKGGKPAARPPAKPATQPAGKPRAELVAPPGVGPAAPGWGVELTSAPAGEWSEAEPAAGREPRRTVAATEVKPVAVETPAAPRVAPKVSAGGPETMLPRAKPFYFRGKRLALPKDEYLAYCREAAAQSGVPLELVLAIGQQESDFNPDAKSSANARGIMQLRPQAAAEMHVTDRYNAEKSISGGAAYLAKQYKKYGNWDDAVAAYRWGGGSFDAVGKDREKLPPKVKDYLQSVQTLRGQFWLLLSDREKDEQLARGKRGRK